MGTCSRLTTTFGRILADASYAMDHSGRASAVAGLSHFLKEHASAVKGDLSSHEGFARHTVYCLISTVLNEMGEASHG